MTQAQSPGSIQTQLFSLLGSVILHLWPSNFSPALSRTIADLLLSQLQRRVRQSLGTVYGTPHFFPPLRPLNPGDSSHFPLLSLSSRTLSSPGCLLSPRSSPSHKGFSASDLFWHCPWMSALLSQCTLFWFKDLIFIILSYNVWMFVSACECVHMSADALRGGQGVMVKCCRSPSGGSGYKTTVGHEGS